MLKYLNRLDAKKRYYRVLKYILFMLTVNCLFLGAPNSDAITRDPFLDINPASIQNTPPSKLHQAWIPLYFLQAGSLRDFLSKKSLSLLSDQGDIVSDKHSNQLYVIDDQTHIARIRSIVRYLDNPGKQFSIKAKIVTLDKDSQKTLGFLFHSNHQARSATLPLTMDVPNADEGDGEFTLTLAKLPGDHLLDLQIAALEQEGHAAIISDPSLTTLDKQTATIESGAEVPYQESTYSGGTSVHFKKAVLCLKVTPTALPNHNILLKISLNQDKVSALTIRGVPAIQTQKITTQVIVHDHQTVALGGILESVQSTQTDGIPIADHLPLIGKLFQHQTVQHKQQSLMIFITPSILSGNTI